MGTGDSKLAIQKNVFELKEKSAADAPADFWEKFWTMPTSVDDFFATLSSDDIREIRKRNPANLQLAIVKATALISSVAAQREKAPQPALAKLLNAVRLVTRVMPFLLEDSNTVDNFADKYLWQPTPAAPVADQKDVVLAESAAPEPIYAALLNALNSTLFLPNFTISVPKQALAAGEALPAEYAWTSGAGAKSVLSSSSWMDTNRGEVLRALLVCLASTLYRAPAEDSKIEQRVLDIITSKKNASATALFYSLINSAVSYDPIGWGMPYNHMLFRDYKETVSQLSLQVLLALLNHVRLPTTATQSATPTPTSNVYLQLLRDMNNPDDFKFLFANIARLLSNPLSSQISYLPNSSKQVKNPQEVLMLLWKLLLENRAFLLWVIRHDDINRVLVPLLHYLFEGRKDPSQIGLVHLGTFILLFLSGEREFSVAINAPITLPVTIDVPTRDTTYADMLVLVIHKLLVDGQPKLDSLYECLLTVLANVSPYLKSLHMTSAIKLLKLFDALSKPSFLLAHERNHRFLFFLLEVFNNIVQYQYAGNARLVYAIIRNREAFHALSALAIKGDAPKADDAAAEKPAATAAAATAAPATAAAPAPAAVAPATPVAESPVSTPVKNAAAVPLPPSPAPSPAPASPAPAAKGASVPASPAPQPAAAAAAAAKVPSTPTLVPPTAKAAAVPAPAPADPKAAAKAAPAAAPAPADPKAAPKAADPKQAPAPVAAAAAAPKSVAPEPVPAAAPKAAVTKLPVAVGPTQKHPVSGYVATQEWLNSWKPQLPLTTILRLLAGIIPQISNLVEGSATDEAQILAFLQKTTLVGIIPVPHPILIRQYSQNAATNQWFTTYMWGVFFLQDKTPPLFVQTAPKLFVLQQDK